MMHELSQPKSPESLSPREQRAVQFIRKFENSLFQSARKKWATTRMDNGEQQGWLLCGPLSVLQSRVQNNEMGDPLLPYGNPHTEEHLKISRLHIYNNKGYPPTDHTFYSRYDGKGGVLHIDPVYDLLWGDKQGMRGTNLTGATHIKKYSVNNYPQILKEVYHLEPYIVGSQLYNDMRRYYDYTGIHYPQEFYEALWEAYHDNRITHDKEFVFGEQRVPLLRLGPPLGDIIREVIPGWTGVKIAGSS